MERQRISHTYRLVWQVLVMLLCIILFLPVSRAAAVADSVLIISIPGNSAHQRFISAFKAEMERTLPGINIAVQSLEEYKPSRNSSLLVTLGSRAFRKTMNQSGSMFHALISRELYKKYYPDNRAGKYHLIFNQPLWRMLLLHEIVFPQRRNVGLLRGKLYPSPSYIDELHRESGKYGMKISVERVEDNFSKSLANILSHSDSLLLLPDSTVINRTTINSLVLDSYHKQIPLLGYSRSLVKAGAMLALYSTPEQLGEDAAYLVARIISGNRVSIRNYPKQFTVSVNYKLSRAYGISIPSEKEIHDKITMGKKK